MRGHKLSPSEAEAFADTPLGQREKPLSAEELRELRAFLSSDLAGDPPVPKCIDDGRPISRLLVNVEVLQALLRKHEWSASALNSYSEHCADACPECGGWKPNSPRDTSDGTTGHNGHEPDCALHAAISGEAS